jgi:Domain of unknown function (DUF3786)
MSLDIERRGEDPFAEPSAILRNSDPSAVARKAGAAYTVGEQGSGILEMSVLNGKLTIAWPGLDIVAEPAKLGSFSMKLLTLLYLANTNGAAPTGEMVSYRQLPDGLFYEPVVQRSVEVPIAAAFGTDVAAFEDACKSLGGRATGRGDASYAFNLFPGVVIEFLLWREDEEFPARGQVLFDSGDTDHLGAFNLRMAAQEISSRLLKARG